MNVKEALEEIEYLRDEYQRNCGGYPYDDFEMQAMSAFDVAMEALEKQIPKKPDTTGDVASGNWVKVCPKCHIVLMMRITTAGISYPIFYNHTPYCVCGQAIDWSDKEEYK